MGLLTDDQYKLIQLAAGKSASNDDKSEKIGLFKQILTDYYKVKAMQTQVQIDLADRAWEYESGKVDKNNKPIYEYHASIWKGNGEIWECMDPNGVRTRNYQKYYDYMNSHDMKIKTVKYFRLKEGNK